MIQTRKPRYWLFALPLVLFLAACSPLVKNTQPAAAQPVSLSPGQSLGQTFVTQYDGLAGFEILLAPLSPGEGDLVLHLRSDASADQDLAAANISLERITTQSYYRFPVTLPETERRQYAYAFLEVVGAGEVQVFTAPGDTYLEGALYRNGQAQDAQMTFRLAYDPTQAALGLARQVAFWIGLALVGLFLFVWPGWVLLAALAGEQTAAMPWPARLGIAAGISLAIYPVFVLWTGIFGLNLGPVYAWAPPVTSLAWVAVTWRKRPQTLISGWHIWRQTRPADLAYLLIIGLVLLTRMWATRNIDLPMWGDSFQHTLIAQLLVDHGGLFSSWQPYTELATFTYHFGFHSLAAAFHWVTALPVPTATLMTGQLLNVLAVAAVYPLAWRVGQNRWAGVIAVLIAGLLSPMPMLYVNWGRYTQLAGQVILPAAVILAWLALDYRRSALQPAPLVTTSRPRLLSWLNHPARKPLAGLVALAALTWGGLSLTHYRVLILAILFPLAYGLVRVRRSNIAVLVKRLAALGAAAGLIFLPWFLHVYSGKILAIFAAQILTPSASLPVSAQQANAVGNLFVHLPPYIWLLLPVSAAWLIWRKKTAAAIFSLWWFLILLAANPQWLDLPGAGSLGGSFAILIAAYIPAAVLIGAHLSQWDEKNVVVRLQSLALLRTRSRTLARLICLAPALAALLLVAGAGVWGARQRLGDVNPTAHALATRPDVRAGAWIQENTAPEARFLVNSFFAYSDSVIVGSDGGWWLPLLAQRQASVPPLSYGLEADPWPGYREWVKDLTLRLQTSGFEDPSLLEALQAHGITHVYIGQRQGRVNYAGPGIIEADTLVANKHFRPVYHQDRVWIFEIVP